MASKLLTRPGLHVSGVYVAYFLALGVHVPFWTLWLGDWGLATGRWRRGRWRPGLVMALGMALSAALYPVLGGLTYGLGVVLSATGIALTALLARRWGGEVLAV